MDYNIKQEIRIERGKRSNNDIKTKPEIDFRVFT